MFVAEFQYACFTHNIHLLLIKTEQCATEKLKGDVDVPN